MNEFIFSLPVTALELLLWPAATSGDQQWQNDFVWPDDETYSEISTVHPPTPGIIYAYFSFQMLTLDRSPGQMCKERQLFMVKIIRKQNSLTWNLTEWTSTQLEHLDAAHHCTTMPPSFFTGSCVVYGRQRGICFLQQVECHPQKSRQFVYQASTNKAKRGNAFLRLLYVIFITLHYIITLPVTK